VVSVPYRNAIVVNLKRRRLSKEVRKSKSIEERNMSTLEAETHTLREAYAALNRNDIPAFLSIFDPQIERIEFAELPEGRTYYGLDEVKAHVSQARETWAEGSCEPERFIITDNRLVVFVYVHVKLKHEAEWRKGHVADVYTFQNGKAIQFRTFADRQQALEWAGVKASEAT
jgi:uncharacterized protein